VTERRRGEWPEPKLINKEKRGNWKTATFHEKDRGCQWDKTGAGKRWGKRQSKVLLNWAKMSLGEKRVNGGTMK